MSKHDRNEHNHGLFTDGPLFTKIDKKGRMQTTAGQNVTLKSGEIGVVFCLPIFVAPTLRLPDVKLKNGQFGRINCGLTSIDVSCVRKSTSSPAATRNLLPGQFVVITCECC